MATLDQILSELDNSAGFGGQINNLRAKQAEIPNQIQAEEQGLQARQTQAFDSILGGARQRGLGFSGIPLQEQAKYTSTEFLPALARLKQSGREQQMGLEDAILQTQERRRAMGQSIYDNDQQRVMQERQFAEQQRQFNEQLAMQKRAQASSAASQFRPSVGAPQTKGAQTPPPANFVRRQDGGFNFTDQSGKAMSAGKYAQVMGQDIRDVLYQMGEAGDKYSQQLYNKLATDNNFGRGNAAYDKKIYETYKPIFWGSY